MHSGTVFSDSLCMLYLVLSVQILIPFLVVTCTFRAVHTAVNVPTQSLILVVLVMSDFMALVSRVHVFCFSSFVSCTSGNRTPVTLSNNFNVSVPEVR